MMKAPNPVWDVKDDAVSERAAEFFERQRFGGWSDGDQAELDAWIAESFRHRAAWLRVRGIVAYTEHLAAVHTFKVGEGASRDGRNVRRFVLPLLAAASIALVTALGIPFVERLTQPVDRSFSTDVGGRTALKFVDGTEIELNTDTVMRFRMTTDERTVWLDRGEAWFHVAHDAAHPFTVVVDKHRVTDLGTEFLVRRGEGQMEVALVTGRAALSTEGTPTATLTPGDDALATPVSVSITRKTPQELADELAWRKGMLVFRDTPLTDVVREFNRYNRIKLVIADPAIADVKISTDVKVNDVDGFLQRAEIALNLRAEREGNEIRISRGPREKTERSVHARHD